MSDEVILRITPLDSLRGLQLLEEAIERWGRLLEEACDEDRDHRV